MRLNVRRWISAPSARSCTSSASCAMKSAYSWASTAAGFSVRAESDAQAASPSAAMATEIPIPMAGLRFILGFPMGFAFRERHPNKNHSTELMNVFQKRGRLARKKRDGNQKALRTVLAGRNG